ncbi:MAG TPA: hypothetical protein VHT92_00015 [Candidatus Cybelea sp.]|jgi:hypothetical protein|nr:hypothetical protein [Candidatus Cybelea sp.]
MARYLVLSALIVISVAVVVAGWVNRDLIRIKIASVYARVPPKPAARTARTPATPNAFQGDAPWALSALPECLTQTSESNGTQAYVRTHLPAGAERVEPPSTLVYGDCSIRIVGDEAYVRRGNDRLRIPPRAIFYRAKRSLALIRETPQGAELRVYEPAQR